LKFPGFIGPAYQLDSVNVEAQRCVNLYLELIQSGTGKEGEVAYLRSTPGLTRVITVGAGPIRLVHTDSIGRSFVVSGTQVFRILRDTNWALTPTTYSTYSDIAQASDINTGTETITRAAHGYYTGLKVQLSSTVTMPTGLVAATDYWVIVVDADHFKLASSLANALASTPVNITAVGTGFLTVTPQIPSVVTGISQSGIDSTADTITKTAHGLYTGLKIRFATIGDVSGGIAFLTDYFVIKIDANTFKLASSIANASASTAIDITTVSGTWTQTLLGANGLAGGTTFTLSTSTGPVKASSMSYLSDGTESSTLFVDGTHMYWFQDDGATSEFGRLTSFGFTEIATATDVTWIDGYFIVNESGTNKFHISDLQSPNFGGLSFASAEGAPDALLAVMDNQRELWLFGERTTEIFVDTGNSDFPFERVQGGFIETGCVAKFSVAKIDGTLFWLGRTDQGQGIVYAAKGSTPQRISTHPIEQSISGYADMSTAVAYTYQQNGHSFYVINFDEATWVYDLSTGLWHERAYSNGATFERHRAGFHSFAPIQSLHLVGDYANAKVYQFGDTVYDDDSNFIARLRSSPHLSSDLNLVFCSKFQLDMETGVGLVSGQGSDPQVILTWSDDGGHTWSDETWTSAGGQVGGIGDYKKRVIWRRLGSFRDRVFRVKITDPVKVVLLGAHLDITAGAS
jgi:hypothetical protein